MNKKIKIALGVILVLIILCCMGSCFLGKAAKSLPKNIKETTNTDSKTIKPTKEKTTETKKTVEPTKKATEKPTAVNKTVEPTKEVKKEKTMAEMAYDKLHTGKNIDYLAAMNILTEIDVTVNPLRDEKTGGEKAYWKQTFEFTDKSRIQLTKYQENGNFILMSSETKIIK